MTMCVEGESEPSPGPCPEVDGGMAREARLIPGVHSACRDLAWQRSHWEVISLLSGAWGNE